MKALASDKKLKGFVAIENNEVIIYFVSTHVKLKAFAATHP